MKLFNALTDIVGVGGLLVVIALYACGAHAATTSTAKHANSLGAIQYQDNPNIYKAGRVAAVALVDGNLVLRVQPLATYSLFTEDVLICGAPDDLFEGKHNPMLLTYRAASPRLVRGVGCHTLLRVDELTLPQSPEAK